MERNNNQTLISAAGKYGISLLVRLQLKRLGGTARSAEGDSLDWQRRDLGVMMFVKVLCVTCLHLIEDNRRVSKPLDEIQRTPPRVSH